MAPDPAPQAPQWYLSLNGKPTGPFTTEQLRMLIRDRQIPPNNPVTAPHLKGAWVHVSSVIGTPAPAQAAPQQQKTAKPAERAAQSSASFQPPPRPEGSEPKNSPLGTPSSASSVAPSTESAASSFTASPADATDSLFDALQAAKERKAKAHVHEDDSLIQAPAPRISKRAMLVVGAFVLVGIIAIAAVNFFAPPGTMNKLKTDVVKNFGAVKPISDPNFGPKNSAIKPATPPPPVTPVTREMPRPGTPTGGISAGVNPRSISPPAPAPPHDAQPIDSDHGNYRPENKEEAVRNPYDNQGYQPPPQPQPPAYDPNYAAPAQGYPQQPGGYPPGYAAPQAYPQQPQYPNQGVQGGGYPNPGYNAQQPQQQYPGQPGTYPGQPGVDQNGAPLPQDPNMMQNAPPPAQFQSQPTYE